MREELELVRTTLLAAGEPESASLVTAALAGDDAQMRAFLVSNELWGGSGSIANQAEARVSRDILRCDIAAALADLGESQTRAGVTHLRTAGWVEIFRSWTRDGI